MLQLNLKAKILEAGILHPVTWLSHILKCSRNKAHKMLSGKKKSLSVPDLAVICYHLNCSPDDLFLWEPAAKLKLSAKHNLRKIAPISKKSNRV